MRSGCCATVWLEVYAFGVRDISEAFDLRVGGIMRFEVPARRAGEPVVPKNFAASVTSFTLRGVGPWTPRYISTLLAWGHADFVPARDCQGRAESAVF